MKRKIIKQGHNTLTLTLPSEWTKKLNLCAGDELDLLEQENSLVINSTIVPKEKSCTIDIRDLTLQLLWRYFQSAYRSGCSEIKITFDPEKKDYEDAFSYYTTQFEYSRLGEKVPKKHALDMIQGFADRFIGMGIIETGKDYCIIKELAAPSIKEFDNSLRRIFLVIEQMFDRILEILKLNEIGNTHICREFHGIDLNVDRLVDYCCRVLNTIPGAFPEQKRMLLFSTLFILELAADEFKFATVHVAQAKDSIKEVSNLAEKVKEYFSLYERVFYDFNRKDVINLGKSCSNLYKYELNHRSKYSADGRRVSRHLMLITKFLLSLIELRIEMEF